MAHTSSSAEPRPVLTLSAGAGQAGTAYRGRQSRHISSHLTIVRHISPHLATSRHISSAQAQIEKEQQRDKVYKQHGKALKKAKGKPVLEALPPEVIYFSRTIDMLQAITGSGHQRCF